MRQAEERFLRCRLRARLRVRLESVLRVGELFKITSEENDWAGDFNQRYMKLWGNLVGEMRRAGEVGVFPGWRSGCQRGGLSARILWHEEFDPVGVDLPVLSTAGPGA